MAKPTGPALPSELCCFYWLLTSYKRLLYVDFYETDQEPINLRPDWTGAAKMSPP